MATSYKALWQGARAEVEKLETKVKNLRARNDELAAALTSRRTALGDTPQIVDLAGIARHMLVERFTPQQWAQRGHLPPVDFPEIREPLWCVSTLKEQFVRPTGRMWFDNPAEADEEDVLDARARRRGAWRPQGVSPAA